MRNNLSEATKKNIAGKQHYKCANLPRSKIAGLENYKCILWNIRGENKRCFDESGYEIDHISEYCISKNNDITNLHALCISCHRVKTKRFLIHNNKRQKVLYQKTNKIVHQTRKILVRQKVQTIVQIVVQTMIDYMIIRINQNVL